MTRAIVVDPLADYSTQDVANGWVMGLRYNGVQTLQFNLTDRFVFYRAARIEHDDYTKEPLSNDQAKEAATLNLLAEVYRHDPDLVVVIHGAHLWAPLLAELRCPLVWVMTECPYEDEAQVLTAQAAQADVILVNDPTNQGVFEQVAPTYYVPHSYNPQLHRPDGPIEGPSDVCFVGTGYPSRRATLEAVDWDGINLALLGDWPVDEDSPIAGAVRSGPVDNIEAIRWYRGAAINLNMYRDVITADECSTADGWAMGPREVELAGMGAFYLREPRPESDAILGFLPAWHDPAEIGELVRWWLPRLDQRKRLGAQAHEAVQDRTFDAHAARLLARLAP